MHNKGKYNTSKSLDIIEDHLRLASQLWTPVVISRLGLPHAMWTNKAELSTISPHDTSCTIHRYSNFQLDQDPTKWHDSDWTGICGKVPPAAAWPSNAANRFLPEVHRWNFSNSSALFSPWSTSIQASQAHSMRSAPSAFDIRRVLVRWSCATLPCSVFEIWTGNFRVFCRDCCGYVGLKLSVDKLRSRHALGRKQWRKRAPSSDRCTT